MAANDDSPERDIEAAIDELYRAPLDRFTADRNALAATLRQSGRRADADRVKGLGKPGLTAWAVNQAWWRRHAEFQGMLDAGERLRAAHVHHAGGSQADVRSAAEERQRLVDAVIASAVAALAEAGGATGDARHRIGGTVEALASGAVPPGQPMGRLTKDVQASGLEALSALAGLLPAPAAARSTRTTQRPVLVPRTSDAAGARGRAADGAATGPADGGATHRDTVRRETARRDAARREAIASEAARRKAEAKARLVEREAALREARAEAAKAAAAEKKARTALEAAGARVSTLEEQLDEARERERAARRAASQAAARASETDMVQRRTERDVERARAALDET